MKDRAVHVPLLQKMMGRADHVGAISQKSPREFKIHLLSKHVKPADSTGHIPQY